MKSWMAVVVSSGWLSGVAAAQTPPDTVHISAQADAVESARGGSLGLTWVNPVSERAGIDLGGSSGAIWHAWWAYGRLGGFLVKRRVGLSGTVDAGGGVAERRGFGYERVRGELSIPVAANRLQVETEGQVSRMASDVRRVVRAGASWRASSVITVHASYYWVSAGGATSPMMSAKVDLERGKVGVLGGLVVTQEAFAAPLARQMGAFPTVSNELFAGCRFPVGPYRMLLTIDVSSTPHPAVRLLTSIKIPRRSVSGTAQRQQSAASETVAERGTKRR